MSKIINISKHPFAQYSAEEEIDLEAIYYEQQYYSELLELTKNGVSRFILGQRGHGKSATIHHLMKDLKESKILTILIRRYDDFPEKNNKAYYLYSMIQGIIFELAKYLYANPKLLKKLDKVRRNELGILIEAFYDEWLAEDFLENSIQIKRKKIINFYEKLWNSIVVRFANKGANVFAKITSQTILQHLGIVIDSSLSDYEYFQNVKYSEIKQISKNKMVLWQTERFIKILQNLIKTSKIVGFKSIVILFDQIDEVKSINSDINKVAGFMEDLLSDTNLLYTHDLSIVISLWSEIKPKLNSKNIRFDKFKEVDIRWKNEELIKLLDKRLKFYSVNKNKAVTFASLVPNKMDQDTILNLAGGSPRALLTLMSYIMNEEETGANISEFSSNAISKGCITFCKKFDYISLQPSRTGKSNDLMSWINKILCLRLVSFTAKQYGDFYKDLNDRTISNHINQMQKLNIIKNRLLPSENGMTTYQVVDPRIIHMIERGVLEFD
ncbi:MAG: hypothetical protein E7065_09275 [Lentimicrobiaceae bacterium]|nr:hypothetical protein [Lentimicrobiaceae bacterium]